MGWTFVRCMAGSDIPEAACTPSGVVRGAAPEPLGRVAGQPLALPPSLTECVQQVRGGRTHPERLVPEGEEKVRVLRVVAAVRVDLKRKWGGRRRCGVGRYRRGRSASVH
jgi:hypothetical protein